MLNSVEVIPLLMIIADPTKLLSNCKLCRNRSPQFFADYQRQANVLIIARRSEDTRASIAQDQRRRQHMQSPEIISIAYQWWQLEIISVLIYISRWGGEHDRYKRHLKVDTSRWALPLLTASQCGVSVRCQVYDEISPIVLQRDFLRYLLTSHIRKLNQVFDVYRTQFRHQYNSQSDQAVRKSFKLVFHFNIRIVLIWTRIHFRSLFYCL